VTAAVRFLCVHPYTRKRKIKRKAARANITIVTEVIKENANFIFSWWSTESDVRLVELLITSSLVCVFDFEADTKDKRRKSPTTFDKMVNSMAASQLS
jgi:hypothetical protein